MKNILKIYSAAIFFLLGTQSANAGFSDWEATITAFDADSATYHHRQAYGATSSICKTGRVSIINEFQALGYIVYESPCTAIYNLPNEEKMTKWSSRLRWPRPVCLSCPFLDNLIIDRVYPDYADRVKRLKDVYQIEEYNKALLNLQSKFKLERFEKAMLEIELKQELNRFNQ